MTTILKAVQLESGELGFDPDFERTRYFRFFFLALALLALGGAALVFFAQLRIEPTGSPLAPPVSSPSTAPVENSSAERMESDVPWGRVEERNHNSQYTQKPLMQRAPKLVAHGAAPTRAGAANGSRIEVKSIRYSQSLPERSATLRIAGAAALTLHEGESAQGVEVQLILPRTVYLRQGSAVFAVNVGG